MKLHWITVCAFAVLVSTVTAKPKPNVLFIPVDDLNDYVTLLQHFPEIRTPNLERLAQRGVTFTRAYCAGPICNPSRAALLTGIQPSRSGIYTNHDHWTQSKPVNDAVSIPEHFRKHGYLTFWAGKLYHDLSAPSAERLIGAWDDMGNESVGSWSGRTNMIPWGPYPPKGQWYMAYEGPETDFADVTNAQLTVERLQREYDQPFFMVMGIIRPHRPWSAPKRFFDMYPLDKLKLPQVLDNDLEDLPPMGKKIAGEHGVNLTELRASGEWKKRIQAYLACCSFADETLGKILDGLDRSPHRDNTLICLWADHGYHMGEKEHMGKWTLWEQGTRNLFMMSVPGLAPPNSRCSQPVSLLDIYPTLVDLCGLPAIPHHVYGRSLRTLLQNPRTTWERPVLTTYPKGCHTLRTGRWRYIRYSDGGEELYDHQQDSHEWFNLAGDPRYRDVISGLQKWLPQTNVAGVGPHPAQEHFRKMRSYIKREERGNSRIYDGF